MITVQEKYNKYLKGDITRSKLLYEFRRDPNLSQFITNVMSFDDSISVLKNRGVLTEAKKPVTELTLDSVNPYEYKIGMDVELDLCYKATPNVVTQEEFKKAQKKVFSNLSKDPNFYTKSKANMKTASKPDLASSADFGEKTKRKDVNIPVGKENFNDKANAPKITVKKEKANVKGKIQGNKNKLIKENNQFKKQKVTNYGISDFMGDFSYSDVGGGVGEAKYHFPKGRSAHEKDDDVEEKAKRLAYDDSRDVLDKEKYQKILNTLKKENIAQANTNVLPFANVKAGMQAVDDSGEKFKVLATGDYNSLKRYDGSKTMDKFLSSDPSGIDGNQLVALIDQNGNTFVRVYGTGGVYVYDNQTTMENREKIKNRLKELFAKEFGATNEYSNTSDLKNKKKAYLQAKIKADQEEMNSLREIGGDADFESEIVSKDIPEDETEKAEAKAAILTTITKAGLHNIIDLDTDVAVKGGYIWVKLRVGTGILDKEKMKALCGDAKFQGANPINNEEMSLVFSK